MLVYDAYTAIEGKVIDSLVGYCYIGTQKKGEAEVRRLVEFDMLCGFWQKLGNVNEIRDVDHKKIVEDKILIADKVCEVSATNLLKLPYADGYIVVCASVSSGLNTEACFATARILAKLLDDEVLKEAIDSNIPDDVAKNVEQIVK